MKPQHNLAGAIFSTTEAEGHADPRNVSPACDARETVIRDADTVMLNSAYSQTATPHYQLQQQGQVIGGATPAIGFQIGSGSQPPEGSVAVEALPRQANSCASSFRSLTNEP